MLKNLKNKRQKWKVFSSKVSIGLLQDNGSWLLSNSERDFLSFKVKKLNKCSPRCCYLTAFCS